MTAYECAYCGRMNAATDDHIPPKTFFHGALDGALPTVRSCSECNTGASLDDEYFRDKVLQYHLVTDLPRAQPLVQKMLRAAAMPAKAAYARKTIDSMLEIDAVTPSGLILPNQSAIRVDGDRLSRAARRYARGLHRYCFGERVLADTPVLATVNPEHINLHADEFISAFSGAEIETVQEGVFWYARLRPATHPERSYWFLSFFNVFPITVAIRPSAPLPKCTMV